MITRRTALLGAAFVLAQTRRSAAQSPTLTPVRISSTANDDITAALYALHEDLFRKAGLDVSLNTLSSGAAISAAVAGGAVDIGRSSMLPLIAARSRGIAFELVSPSGLYSATSPVAALLVPVNSPVRAAKDLAGKIVSIPALGDLDGVGVRYWIDVNGGDSRAVQYVEMPGSAVANELQAGRVAAGTLQNPFMAQALKSGTFRVLGYYMSALAPRFLQSAWFATNAYLGANAAAARAFARVMQTASVYCNTHQAQTVDLIASFTKMDPATVAGMSRTFFAPAIDPGQIQPLIDAAYKYKAIDRAFDANEFIAHLS